MTTARFALLWHEGIACFIWYMVYTMTSERFAGREPEAKVIWRVFSIRNVSLHMTLSVLCLMQSHNCESDSLFFSKFEFCLNVGVRHGELQTLQVSGIFAINSNSLANNFLEGFRYAKKLCFSSQGFDCVSPNKWGVLKR